VKEKFTTTLSEDSRKSGGESNWCLRNKSCYYNRLLSDRYRLQGTNSSQYLHWWEELRASQDSCHVWDPLLDRSQENQSVASTERIHRGSRLFVYGPAEWRTLCIKKESWQNRLLHTERRQLLSKRSVKFMLRMFMQMQIFSLISIFLINVILFLLFVCRVSSCMSNYRNSAV
jgi:hypothetical protein